MLAAVHAMAIYQILGFFTSTNPEQTRLAELQQLFFLKMVRKLISTHLPPRPNASSSNSPQSQSQSQSNGNGTASDETIFGIDWRKWLITETIRRTVFLANTINTLSYRTQKQNPYYYEALDDDSVLNMLLPAPMSVWKASSEEEWLAARGNLSPEERTRSRMTVKMVLEQVSGQSTGAGSGAGAGGGRGGRKARDKERERVNFEDLDEFARVVISTAKAYGLSY
jgi:PKD repeat protein